jgi:alpha-L-arabinofuranosidase
MFATNLGTHVLSTTPTAGSGTVWWVASVNQRTKTYYLKVANTGAAAVNANILLEFNVTSTAQTTVLTGEKAASNTLESPNVVVPVQGRVEVEGERSITYTFPPYSVVVFRLGKA